MQYKDLWGIKHSAEIYALNLLVCITFSFLHDQECNAMEKMVSMIHIVDLKLVWDIVVISRV